MIKEDFLNLFPSGDDDDESVFAALGLTEVHVGEKPLDRTEAAQKETLVDATILQILSDPELKTVSDPVSSADAEKLLVADTPESETAPSHTEVPSVLETASEPIKEPAKNINDAVVAITTGNKEKLVEPGNYSITVLAEEDRLTLARSLKEIYPFLQIRAFESTRPSNEQIIPESAVTFVVDSTHNIDVVGHYLHLADTALSSNKTVWIFCEPETLPAFEDKYGFELLPATVDSNASKLRAYKVTKK